MKKVIILTVLLGSCATPQPKPNQHPVHDYKSRQDLILDCYKFLKSMGASDKTAGEFCPRIYKED